MKKLYLQNKLWSILFTLAFASSLFLLYEYKSTSEIASNSKIIQPVVEKKASIDEDEFESTDFYIFKNISELINDIFSIGL